MYSYFYSEEDKHAHKPSRRTYDHTKELLFIARWPHLSSTWAGDVSVKVSWPRADIGAGLHHQ
jgi:hypothetical protein